MQGLFCGTQAKQHEETLSLQQTASEAPIQTTSKLTSIAPKTKGIEERSLTALKIRSSITAWYNQNWRAESINMSFTRRWSKDALGRRAEWTYAYIIRQAIPSLAVHCL